MRTVLAIATVAWASSFASGADKSGLKVGDDAPAWELPGSDGKTYKSSDLKGKRAYVISWYPKAFTGG